VPYYCYLADQRLSGASGKPFPLLLRSKNQKVREYVCKSIIINSILLYNFIIRELEKICDLTLLENLFSLFRQKIELSLPHQSRGESEGGGKY
jgi:hypothetical protein